MPASQVWSVLAHATGSMSLSSASIVLSDCMSDCVCGCSGDADSVDADSGLCGGSSVSASTPRTFDGATPVCEPG